ncbi:metal ABC transporter permease [Thermosynechococcus sp. QKsg1]|uniref:metal ABC transporter permease n=1 Tax=unclassified Thermosynechococcus TaxID=2622553 RepID=UPI002577FB68|nr:MULTISPECIES: metal ABC transporter permease [unclassified Thermosynechococcus]WJI24388.1 metal ABC transporter permease [Thermosynechococcus sp. B0]WJI26909.1 metal ABC transporter permease [Thermosynechococcus sp. B1]WKT84019.1 metal ABC transporter permease [Thermosynechococcus sp. HY596]WNC63153.1 metal ABC transporter permease [Thermosynechococcus sp. HY591]WNC65713.1 metal ABC transporter permease [Thermosynechococcus sp. HY593]
MSTWLLEPLQHTFMVKALGVSTLVGCVCAVLSCFLTLKGWALMGDAVSHAVLPGVILAYWLGLPFALGAFVFGLMAVTLIGFIQRQTRVKEDTVIGLVFTGFFALGLVLLSKTASSVDLMHILFGNVLGISDRDLWQTVIVSLMTLITIALLHRDLILFCFDPTHARTIGLNTTLLYYLLLALLSLTTVAALQTVGIILVVAMLITPGATAYLLSDRFGIMVLIALAVGGLGSLLGTYISYYLDASTGGCIVVLQTVIFLLAMIFAPKHGLLAKARSPLS